MTFTAGQVVATSENRKGIVWGKHGRYMIVLQIVRARPKLRSDVPVSGRIQWSEAEAATPGYVAAGKPRLVPPSMLRLIGAADDALMAACLKAQIREIAADDAPDSESVAEIKAEMAAAQGAVSEGRVAPKRMAD